ncbi:MAG: hypothetical protein IKX86_05070 [Clostridia bacterium]|nr:hypothetical protein [Clostridia bacterium]
MEEKDIADNKVMAVLAYFGILFLIPLLAAKESKYARFHTNQGIILFIVGIIVAALSWIPVLGWLLALAVFVLFIFGVVNAAQGKAKDLPLIGSFRILK